MIGHLAWCKGVHHTCTWTTLIVGLQGLQVYRSSSVKLNLATRSINIILAKNDRLHGPNLLVFLLIVAINVKRYGI